MDSSTIALNSPELEDFYSQVIIDWLAFTVPVSGGVLPSDMAADWVALLGGGSMPLGFGRFGYADSIVVLGSGSVYWSDTRPEMGVHVELPASALGHLAQAQNVGPVDVVDWIEAAGGKCTRIDVACDTHHYTMSHVMAAYNAGGLVTRIQKKMLMTDLETGGQTLYLGGSGSRRRVRIYDKAAEQGLQGAVWTRCEVQFRREDAKLAAQYVASIDDMRQLIRSVIDFRDFDPSDSAKTRWRRSDWWISWMGAGDSLSFARQKVFQTIDKAKEYIIC